jgi:hypothetical protein
MANLSEAELLAYASLWLLQAQATNDLDADAYSHGVFAVDVPLVPPSPRSLASR